MPILPHGGVLIDRIAKGNEREQLLEKAPSLPKIHLNPREISDLEMIAVGALSPFEGFMRSSEYKGVIDLMRLPNGLRWPLPRKKAIATGREMMSPSMGRVIISWAFCTSRKSITVTKRKRPRPF
jgi:ATP sulfurylase